MKNKEIKDSIKIANLHQWQIAEELGIGESTLCRKMRHELSEIEKKQIYEAIEKVQKGRSKHGI
ncbi:hypothetical protein [Acetobacterium sp.]|uniref:hypothetical protein n=1 Tax=Acetobacterium sp. TaxID=1872094 RepID=UPI003593BDE3